MIPTPQGADWKAWAFRVVQVLTPWMTRIERTFVRQEQIYRMRSATVATLPSASPAGQWIHVTDETGGAVPCFSDGTNWRRVTDRAVAS